MKLQILGLQRDEFLFLFWGLCFDRWHLALQSLRKSVAHSPHQYCLNESAVFLEFSSALLMFPSFYLYCVIRYCRIKQYLCLFEI